jgi:superfamily I DNA/RNA helicase
MGAMDRLPNTDAMYVRRVLSTGWRPGHEIRHRISTLHSIKGGEADNVLLPTETSDSAWRTMARDMDEEMRVWYVGCSRARKRLVVIPSNKFSVHNFLA